MSILRYIFFLVFSFLWANLYLILLVLVILFLFAFLIVSVSLAKANLSGYLELLKTSAIPVLLLGGTLYGLRFSYKRIRSDGAVALRTLLAVVGLVVSGILFYVNYHHFLLNGWVVAKLFYHEFFNMINRFRS